MAHVIAPENVKQFIFSGRANFIVQDEEYKTRQVLHCIQNQQNKDMFWVHQESKFLGTIYKEKFKIKEPGNVDAHVLLRFFTLLLNGGLPSTMCVTHFGTCGACRRPLTDPLSIELGIGPECRKKLGIK